MTSSVKNQLQASSTNSTRLSLIGVASCSLLLRQLHLVRSVSPPEHTLSKSLIGASHSDALKHLSMGLQCLWCLVINSAAIPHSKMHKRWVALLCHRVRHAVAAKIINVHHVAGKKNPACVLSEHWDLPSVWNTIKPLLLWNWKLMGQGTVGAKEGSSIE